MKLTILEIRQPLNDPSVNVRTHSDNCGVFTSRDKAVRALKADPTMGGDDEVWCFAVFDQEADTADVRPQNLEVYAFDGTLVAGGHTEAWDMLREARNVKSPKL